MVSRRKDLQKDARLRVMQIISQNPEMTTREIAKNVGISHGSAYYTLTSLIDMGFIKLSNLKESKKKRSYQYLLTAKGVREKSLITYEFIRRKKQEFVSLKEEIDLLEKSLGDDVDNIN